MDQIARAALAAIVLIASAAGAQTATFKGVVLTDSTERPIPGVTVAIETLKLSTTTDSLGRFSLSGVAPGPFVVSAKKVGFGPVSTRIIFNRGATVEADLLLTANVQALPEVTVETKKVLNGKMGEFEERRLAGQGGRFLTQADLEKRPFSVLSNALRTIPGLEIKSQGRDQWVAAGRMSVPGGVLAGGGGNGPPPPCPVAVVLDGIFVYGAGDATTEPKFSINQVNISTLAGIEYYASAASMPVKWNATRHTCGLLVLWTK